MCEHRARVGDSAAERPATAPLRFELDPSGAPRGAWLVTATGQEISLDRSELVIGRSPSCDIAWTDDVTLSRRTCALRFAGGGCVVEDLDSRCGTLVNDRRVSRAGLHEGDVVRVGSRCFTVERRPWIA